MKSLKYMPPIMLNVPSILDRADGTKGVMAYDSKNSNMAYAADKYGLVVMTTSRGYLRLKPEEVSGMIEELQNIGEDMKIWAKD